MRKLIQFFLMLLLINLVAQAENSKTSSIRFSGIPALGFGPDTGFGTGVIGTMYVDEEGYIPYKMALGIKAFLTTKGVNSHAIQLDQVKAFGLPLRLTSRLGFYSTIAQAYCGPASDANCDKNRAEAAAGNLKGTEREDFIRHYYQHRFMSFFGDIMARSLLWKDIAKLELMTSYRGRYYLNRDFKNKGPYPGSLYEKDFKGYQTEGYLSTLELGLMLDKRDHEAAPTTGYWLEGSVRGGSWLFGSSWDYLGANLALRFYLSLDQSHRVVIASQSIIDGTMGDLPYDAMSRLGGSQSLNDFSAIGGQYIGRGISEQLFVGRFKAIEQAELRYTFYSFNLLKQNFDLTAAALSDLAVTAWDSSRFSKDIKNLYVGLGGGLRINWNRTFIIRADLGMSPSESFSPKFYLTVGNVF